MRNKNKEIILVTLLPRPPRKAMLLFRTSTMQVRSHADLS